MGTRRSRSTSALLNSRSVDTTTSMPRRRGLLSTLCLMARHSGHSTVNWALLLVVWCSGATHAPVGGDQAQDAATFEGHACMELPREAWSLDKFSKNTMIIKCMLLH